MTQLKIIDNGIEYDFNLSQAADHIGMAKSTFSAHWRVRISDNDQEAFDHIRTLKRGYTPRRTGTARSKQAISRHENNSRSEIKPLMDRFLLGVMV
jgi:hypothetical protein